MWNLIQKNCFRSFVRNASWVTIYYKYWVIKKLPQIYTAKNATFPIRIRKITVQIFGNFWVTQYNGKRCNIWKVSSTSEDGALMPWKIYINYSKLEKIPLQGFLVKITDIGNAPTLLPNHNFWYRRERGRKKEIGWGVYPRFKARASLNQIWLTLNSG